MTGYNLRRLDGDPGYAPGRVFDRGTPWWRPTKVDVQRGFPIKGFRLTGLTEEEQCAKCRDLVRELLRWRDGLPKVTPHSWGWIIALYKSDELSPYQTVKANTRADYRDHIAYWEEAIGDVLIKDTDFRLLKSLQLGMQKAGRSTAFIHKKLGMLSRIASFGVAINPGLFRDVRDIFASRQMKASAPKPRTVYPTADQILAVIAAADAAGNSAFALGLSLQWWLTLRAVDVRGQWLEDGKSRRWADGMTWGMVNLETKTITKMPSKTERHDARPMVWDLTPLPDLVARLEAIPKERRFGVLIKKPDGTPFSKRHYAALWRRFADQAGVPKEVWLMDTRAGALNDAMKHGADRLSLQHAANHKDGSTTERYIRDREAGANNVIELRAGTSAKRA